MGKYVLTVCLILCTAMLGMAVAQQQQEQKPPKTEQKPPKAEPKPPNTEQPAKASAYAGEVVSVDATKNEIVVKNEEGAETKLLVSKSTKITKDGKDATLGDVKGGDKLTSECEASSDGCKAKSIQVTTPPQG
jgi:ABC-type Fe3+-hydroxamate transport system substrate-binding protein